VRVFIIDIAFKYMFLIISVLFFIYAIAQYKKVVKEERKEKEARKREAEAIKQKYIYSLKEMKLSDNEKIELLIKNSSFHLPDDEINDCTDLIHDLGCDYYDIEWLKSKIKHIFNIDVQEGGLVLNVGGVKEYVKKKLDDPTYIVRYENLHPWPETLEECLYREYRYARQLAIKQLIDNNYQILNDEFGNRFKEPINFTLNLFRKLFKDNPTETHDILKSAFPLMHQFIYRQIFKQKNIISIDDKFDEQVAYDEFLYFCKEIFLSYPDKNERNLSITRHFKLMHNDITRFIEER